VVGAEETRCEKGGREEGGLDRQFPRRKKLGLDFRGTKEVFKKRVRRSERE
jgi:hypothetical protein